MLERAKAWWQQRTSRERVHAVVLLLVTVGAVVHQAVLWNWYIEDAAISFAYARNLADGEGLVANVGFERVEGYSNPTWVFLLAVLELFGLNSFDGSKIAQLVLCALTVPLTYLVARHAVDREDSHIPLFAAVLLAGNTQFAIWGASGLENSLFCFLLALGLWRTLEELRSRSFPWSATVFFLVAISRPEALMYAAIAGGFWLIFTLADGRGLKPTLQWLGAFWLPFIGYHLARFAYFAYELPATFYAKIGDHREPRPMNWNGHGWRYARNWASRLGQGFLIPVYLLGLSGPRGGRAGAALTLASVLGLIVLLPTDQRLLLPVVLAFTFVCYQGLIQSQGDGPRVGATVAGLALVLGFAGAAEIMRARGGDASLPSPDWLPSVTSYVFVCAALLAPLLAWKTPGARARVLCWAMFCSGLVFAISVHGDWMKGWRWMSLVSVPGSVVLACGVSAGASVVQGAFTARPQWVTIGWVAALTLLISPIPVQIQHTVEFAKKPETGPFSVRARVNYKNKLKNRLHWYGPVTDLDVDQGAHLWWSGHRMLDIAGLVDVPLGQHKFDRSFITEYLFEENKPHFAHVHGGWANNSRIPSNPAWRRDYVEVPGYPAGQMLHIGNFIRRDLLMAPEWDSLPDRRVPLSQDLVLEGWRIPSGVTAPDRRLYIEVAVSTSKRRRHRDNPRMLVFLVDPLGQTLVSWDLALGYDWLMPHKWTDREVFVGRYSPMIPASVPQGEYELGFLFLDSEGRVLPAMRTMHPDDPTFAAPPAGAIVPGLSQIPARLARGEVRFTRAVTVGPVEAVIDASMARLGEAHTNAQANACVEAEDAWFTARTHRPRATPFFEAEGPGVHQAIAECWARKATEEPEQAVAHLARGRDWDRTAPGLVAAIRPVADAHYASGKAALDAEDWETAYRDLSAVLRIAPHRAWARRYAEQARSERLEIVPTTQATREADAKRRRAEAEARRKQIEDAKDEAPPQAPDAP